MVKELIHDPVFLAIKAEAATKEDVETGRDLLETLIAHRDSCVGMAANMIGQAKRIIAIDNDGEYMVMYNPVILKKDGSYKTKESCLSLLGGPRETIRYKSVKVQWQDADFKIKIKTFKGFAAQIIQHEIDHCDGVLI
ncbi:MAG: peptide deformylase [Oscillospiraceae bacterium]|nr:peptide deformylase [Oscillospiraceae bacterium]MBE7055628.1 peptide deformylase [Oscillospiraceae bacterium]MBQ6850027.1 peptide deformylase [Oscillospiraceae bacterium]MBR6610373.1 peptide deformylase [Oscillospiraceae bacterium]